jgi:Alginate export
MHMRVLMLCACFATLGSVTDANAQAAVDGEDGMRIEAIRIELAQPSADEAFNRNLEDAVRRSLGTYPGDRFNRDAFRFALARAARIPGVVEVDYTLGFAPGGGLDLVIDVQLQGGKPAAPAFPVLVNREGRYLRLKLEGLAMYYSNHGAWYGQPESMLAGNPLVDGAVPGAGFAQWFEGYVHFGAYGMVPISESATLYAGASVIGSASVGQELFTDRTRTYTAVEDAYLGVVGGRTTEEGNRLVYNLSAGRQRFSIGEGFLLVNTASNGSNRATLQSNSRWAGDFVALAQVAYNNLRIEAFRVDPDELPAIDSRTVVDGVNVQARLAGGWELGATHLRVPRSSTAYYTPTDQLGREGLRVNDIRVRWQPLPSGQAGPVFSAEYALQDNRNFAMQAIGWTVEAQYQLPETAWSPTVSYRYASFSGDDPDTNRFERWDPLFSGGNGEQWVQGINHFKVVQDANLVTHRLQLRLRPTRQVELVPQAWLFRAPSLTNLGGNPALSFLSSRDYGSELNITAKYFPSRKLYLHGHIAATFPGEAVRAALPGDADAWWSFAFFARYAY